jgi:hypothetical protein
MKLNQIGSNRVYTKRDYLELLLGFAAAITFLVFFTLDIQGRWLKSNSTETLAFIKWISGEVKILPNGELSWFKASTNKNLTKNDTIATGNTGMAELKLKNNDVLELNPNSMLLIQEDKEDLKFSFIEGSGRVRKDDFLETERFHKSAVKKPSPIHKAVDANSIRIPDLSLNTRGESIDNIAINREAAPLLIAPDTLKTFDLNKGEKIVLKWNGQKNSKYLVSLSNAESNAGSIGASVMKQYTARGDQLKISNTDLRPGTYAWDVRALGNSGIHSKPSPSRTFTVVGKAQKPVSVPKLAAPKLLPVLKTK